MVPFPKMRKSGGGMKWGGRGQEFCLDELGLKLDV